MNPMECLQIKNTVFEMKILPNRMNTWLVIVKEKVSKLESITTKFIQNKTLRDMRLKIKLAES